jgi:GTPase Era involved in 16S rRNA processing
VRDILNTGKQSFNALIQTIETGDIFPDLYAGRALLIQLINQIREGYEKADRPLRILVAGGTGVGKSTLLNAMAGADIAQAGQVRPTTRHFTVYIHRDDEDPWVETLKGVQIVRHQRPGLSRKIIIDAPDADSVERVNREILEKALQLADLVWVVVTAEKYVSESVLRMLNRHSRGRRFTFILNKTDLNAAEEITGDLQSEVDEAGFPDCKMFRISALNALANRTESTGSHPEYEFNKLEQFVTDELNELKIREIHRLNLADRTAILADALESALPEQYPDLESRWVAVCETAMDSFQAHIDAYLKRLVLNREELIPALVSQRAAGFTGLFGLTVNLVYFLKRMASQQALYKESGDLVKRIEQRLRAEDEKMLSSGFELLTSTCISEGSAMGLNRESLNKKMNEAIPADMHSITNWVNENAVQTVISNLELHTGKSSRFLSFILNLPAWSWIGYWVYRSLKPLFVSGSTSIQELPGAFIVLLMILGVEYYLVDRAVTFSARTRADKVIVTTMTDLAQQLRAVFSPAVDRVARHIKTCTGTLNSAIRKFRRMTLPQKKS